MTKLDEEYHITKKGVVKSNPGVMPYETLMSINRAWEDIKEGRVVERIVNEN